MRRSKKCCCSTLSVFPAPLFFVLLLFLLVFGPLKTSKRCRCSVVSLRRWCSRQTTTRKKKKKKLCCRCSRVVLFHSPTDERRRSSRSCCSSTMMMSSLFAGKERRKGEAHAFSSFYVYIYARCTFTAAAAVKREGRNIRGVLFFFRVAVLRRRRVSFRALLRC